MRASLWLLLFLLSSLPAVAEDLSYLQASDLPATLLPAPPAEGSPAWEADITKVVAAQKHLSRDDLAAFRQEQHLRVELVTVVLGADFTRETRPKIFALLDRVMATAHTITDADKKYWHTRRPYLSDKDIKLLVDPLDASPSYPSGHTSSSRVIAEVLGFLYPDRLSALRARADAIASDRIKAGVHYPSDIEGGKLLAMIIVGALTQNEDFRADLATAREDVGNRP